MMQRVGARDRPVQVNEASQALSLLEDAMLDSIMKAFLRGLSDPDVRREATRGLASAERTLRGVYSLAEEARRTKSEVQKLNDEEFKSKEIELLRLIVQKTMTKSQLDNIVSSYQTNAATVPQLNTEGLSKLMEKLGQVKHVQDYGGNYPANYHSGYDNYS